MDVNHQNNFLFSSKNRVWRHVVFWIAQVLFFATLYVNNHGFARQLILVTGWVPARMLYTYPLTNWALPKYLLKGKYVQFLFIMLGWAIVGWYLNYFYRFSIMVPYQEFMGFKNILKDVNATGGLLASISTAFAGCMVVLFKHWLKKQQEWLQAEKEKVTAELELLKAQVHPHFLFNTLNNIYSFSLDTSPKVADLIIKLSSLLRYMLYNCKAEHVLLEKEIEVMKNYIDLEKERYGNNIEVSFNISGNIAGKYISPLLLLPFLENAFKHGTSEQLEKPWLSVDLTVMQNTMKCKIANSKNEIVTVNENGIGVQNVKKRLELLYPGRYELRLNNGDHFFVVSLRIELTDENKFSSATSLIFVPVPETTVL